MFYNLIYKKLLPFDNDIEYLIDFYKLPEISKFLSIDFDNFFNYVTETENVYYYKIYDCDVLIGDIDLEINDDVLDLAVLIFPDYQKRGYGQQVIKDVIDNKFGLTFSKIRAYIDISNIASIKLFEKLGFEKCSEEDELVEYIYNCN
jgi:Acetyltransferases, including N-acetylases of ribosomal proteins